VKVTVKSIEVPSSNVTATLQVPSVGKILPSLHELVCEHAVSKETMQRCDTVKTKL